MTITNRPPQKTAVVWTTSTDREGKKVASLLRRAGAKVEVRNLDSAKWKKSDVAAAVPGYTKLPQVVVDNAVIGDLAAVKAHPELGAKLKKPKLDPAARKNKAAENRAKMKSDRTTAAAARAEATKSVFTGRQHTPTGEQRAAAVARAETAKAARIAHTEARVARVLAARG